MGQAKVIYKSMGQSAKKKSGKRRKNSANVKKRARFIHENQRILKKAAE